MRPEEVVGAALSDDDALPGAVDLVVRLQRRLMAHQIAALRSADTARKSDLRGAQRVGGEEADVGVALVQRVDRLCRLVEDDEFESDAQASREILREIDRRRPAPARCALRPDIGCFVLFDGGFPDW